MKNVCFAAAAVVVGCGVAQAAVTYNDSLNDIGIPGFNQQHIDIEKVTMSNDANNLYVTLKMRGGGADWAKYCMMINTGSADVTSTNGWNRPNIGSMPGGMDNWIGSWADGGGGAQQWNWDGFSWNNNNFFNPNYSQFNTDGTIQWQISLAWLGLSVGQTIQFDLITTGGIDSDAGWDYLSNPNPSTVDYSAPSTAGPALFYTLEVPAPGSLALIGLGGLLVGRRRR